MTERSSPPPFARARFHVVPSEPPPPRSTDTQAALTVADGLIWLATVDHAMQGSIAAVQSARELTVRAAGGSASRATIAAHLDDLRDALLKLANTDIQGRPIFAAASASHGAFDDGGTATPYAWRRGDGSSLECHIGADASVRVDADGSDVFGDGPASVFALLDRVSTDLRGTAEVSERLVEFDARLNAMLACSDRIAIRYQRMADAQDDVEGTLLAVPSTVDGLKSQELTERVMELRLQEATFRDALRATTRVVQPTLADFLR